MHCNLESFMATFRSWVYVSLRITQYLSIFIKYQVDRKKEEVTLVYGSSQCYIAL